MTSKNFKSHLTNLTGRVSAALGNKVYQMPQNTQRNTTIHPKEVIIMSPSRTFL